MKHRRKGPLIKMLGALLSPHLHGVHVETPINLTSEQERLIRQLDDSLTGDNKNHRPKEKTWMDSIKDFFE